VSGGLPSFEPLRRHPRLAALDPRARLVAAFLIVAGIAAATRPATLAVALAAVLAGAVAAGARPSEIARRLVHLEGFVVVLLVLLPLTGPGPTLATVGPVAIGAGGLALAVALALKLNAAVLVVLTLIGGMTPVALGRALAGLGLPERLVQILYFAARYVGLLGAEADRLLTAARARGFRPGLSRRTVAVVGLVVGTVLLNALERAERVAEAMRCRGFTGRFAVGTLGRPGAADLAAIGLAAAAALLVVAGDRLW
jgi:cobalt/nickel transport system permease protein